MIAFAALCPERIADTVELLVGEGELFVLESLFPLLERAPWGGLELATRDRVRGRLEAMLARLQAERPADATPSELAASTGRLERLVSRVKDATP
jgi:hypothetical protein